MNNNFSLDLAATTSGSPWARIFGLSHLIDVVIYAEGRAFPANKAILAQHSGYFRTVFSPDTTSIVLPTVPAEYFGLLLAFINPGGSSQLGLITEANVYQLLLYGQLLQMPTVVLQCKAFLAKLEAKKPDEAARVEVQARPVSSTVVRPIPSKIQPSANNGQLWKPWLQYSATLYQDWLTRLAFNVTSGNNSSKCNKEANFKPQPSTSTGSNNSSISQPNNNSNGKKAKKTFEDDERCVELGAENKATTGIDEKVAQLDLAACDGPIRFHRILNPVLTSDNDDSNDNDNVDVVGSSGSDQEESKSSFPRSENSSTVGNNTYKCLFCNHIFKSHYCYQKHKRRHLNPFTVDFATTEELAVKKKPDVPLAPSTILKDINVQFFPCKICGAKFPSYYFVHKHKKIWHPEAIDPAPSSNTSSTSSLTNIGSK